MTTPTSYLIYNTVRDNIFPDAFKDKYHVHILCHKGQMHFSTARKSFVSEAGHLVIWQMTTPIHDISYSADFDADFLMIDGEFLRTYNPEMLYATKGYIFIKNQPTMLISKESQEILKEDFRQFETRIQGNRQLFHDEIIGRLLQILLFDFWNIFEEELDHTQIDDNQSRVFLQFLFLVQEHCMTEREVQFYSDKLFIVPKYLSQICRQVTGKPASYWIEHFATNRLKRMLDDTQLSFTDIADRMNFSTMSFFSRYVKKTLGVTPSEYRKQKS
jgi:AraC-like DNA-binding protein